ncbi:MAG: insulinase family protein [Proteobacteria bacterium]|nr:MAG: insulinase family protein [Pseudomonadota bacterium]
MVSRKKMALKFSVTSLVFALVLTVSGCSTTSRSKEWQSLGLQFDLKEFKLDNGLRVLMVKDPTVPIVSYQTWVNVGSVDEEFGLTGLAHLFEHLMFKGSRNFGPKAFFQELEAKGAAVNAYTTRDYTVYHETFTKDLLSRVIELEADRLSGLNLTDLVLYTEKQVVAEERRLRTENSPDGRMQEALWALAYKSHPYRWPVIGYSEDMNRITIEDLEKFFGRYYQPGNVTLVVVGDFEPREAMEMIRNAYGPIAGHKPDRSSIAREPEQREPRDLILQDAVATTKLQFGYPVTSAEEPDTHALDVMSNILFGGVSSRAYNTLVEEKQLAVGVSGVAYTPAHPGLFLMSAVLRQGVSPEQFEAAWWECVKRLETDGITQEELTSAVRQLTIQTVDSVRTAHGLASLVGTVNAILGDPELYKDDLIKYQKVTAQDVVRVAKKYLRKERQNRVVLNPGRAMAELEVNP